MNSKINVRAMADVFNDDGIKLYFRMRTYQDNALPYTSIPEPIVFKNITKEEQLNHEQQPTIIITPESAQELMNQLWELNIRPVQAKGSVGQLDAVNKHLEDMRRLVFNGEKK